MFFGYFLDRRALPSTQVCDWSTLLPIDVTLSPFALIMNTNSKKYHEKKLFFL